MVVAARTRKEEKEMFVSGKEAKKQSKHELIESCSSQSTIFASQDDEMSLFRTMQKHQAP